MPFRPDSAIREGEDLIAYNVATTPNYGTHSTLFLDPGDRIMFPLNWGNRVGETITDFSIYLGAGGTNVDNLNLRIEEQDTDGPTGTLVDVNATGTIANVGGAAGWVKIPINGGTGITLNEIEPCVVLEVSSAAGQVRLQYSADWGATSRTRAIHAARTWDGVDWDAVVTVGATLMMLWNGATPSQYPHWPYDPAMSFEDFDNANANPFQGVEWDIDFTGKVSGVHGWFYAVNDMIETDVIVLLNDVEVSQRNKILGHTRRYQDGNFEVWFPEISVVPTDRVAVIFNPQNTHAHRVIYWNTSQADVATILGTRRTARYRRGATLGTLATVADRRPALDMMISEIETGGGSGGGGLTPMCVGGKF